MAPNVPRAVVRGATEGYEAGSDIYTRDGGIGGTNPVKCGVRLEKTLAKRSFCRRVTLREDRTKQRSARRGDETAAVERKPCGGTPLFAVLTLKIYFEPVIDLFRMNRVNKQWC